MDLKNYYHYIFKCSKKEQKYIYYIMKYMKDIFAKNIIFSESNNYNIIYIKSLFLILINLI